MITKYNRENRILQIKSLKTASFNVQKIGRLLLDVLLLNRGNLGTIRYIDGYSSNDVLFQVSKKLPRKQKKLVRKYISQIKSKH